MKNIFIVLFLILNVYSDETITNITNIINSKEYKTRFNTIQEKLLLNQLKQHNPTLAKELISIKHDIENQKSKDVVFLFTSQSVSNDTLEKFILQASILNVYFDTEVYLVYQGPTTQEYEYKMHKLRETLSQYKSSEIFFKNFTRIIAPRTFKDLNITKVPVLAYATHKGNSYPTHTDIKYIARGDISLGRFMFLIQKEDDNYEKYYNSIINTK